MAIKPTELSTKLKHTSKDLALASHTLGTLPEKIVSMDEYKMATDACALMSMRVKNATTAMKFFTDPLKAEMVEIKGAFAAVIDPAEELLGAIKDRMKVFYIAEQARADEEQKQIEAGALAQADAGDEKVTVPVVNEIKTQAGAFGSSTARKIKKWRVIDEARVPRQYLIIDDASVTAAMRAGTVVPGVEYYEDISIATRT